MRNQNPQLKEGEEEMLLESFPLTVKLKQT